MALDFGTIGTAGSGTTSCTPAAPASVAVGDPLCLLVVSKYPSNGPSTPTGWSLPTNGQGSGGSGSSGVDSGSVNVTWFTRTADGTADDTPTVSVPSGNSCSAVIIRLTHAAGKAFQFAAHHGAFNTPGTAWSVTMGGDPGITAGDFLLVGSGHNSDTGGVSAHAMSASGLTIGTVTERSDAGPTDGDDHRRFCATALVSSGTASAALVYTATISATAGNAPAGCSVLLRVREADPTTGTVGSSAGTSTAAATGASTAAAAGSSAGVATAAGVATSVVEAVGTAAGTSTASGVTASAALAITTFETIRDAQIAVIHALTPSIRADKKFIKHRDNTDFMTWVETTTNRKACWRRFQVAHNLDIEQGPTADGSIESCRHTEELRIAYPLDWGKYGAENERDLDDVIASDLHQIDAVIGLNGGENYVDGQHLCQKQAQAVLDLEGVRVLSITYLVQYDRSV